MYQFKLHYTQNSDIKGPLVFFALNGQKMLTGCIMAAWLLTVFRGEGKGKKFCNDFPSKICRAASIGQGAPVRTLHPLVCTSLTGDGDGHLQRRGAK